MELRKPQIGLSDSYIVRSYQLLTSLDTSNKTPLAAFVRASNIIYKWIKDRFSVIKIPELIRSYTREYADKFVGIVYSKEEMIFSIMTRHADEEVAGRIWITEAVISHIDGSLIIAVRNSYTCRKVNHEEFIYSPPGFIYRLISIIGITDIRPLQRVPWIIDSEDDVISLFEFVSAADRKLPVIVISQVDKNDYGFALPEYLVNANDLQRNLQAYAHVVQLPHEYTYKWTDLVEKSWSVYDGAIRVYFPSIDFDSLGYFSHPLWIKQRILSAYKADSKGKTLTEGAAFIYTLINEIKHRNSQDRITWKDYNIKSYYNANRDVLETKKSSGTYSSEDALEEMNQLRQDLELHDEYIDCLEKDISLRDSEIAHLKEQMRGLKVYNETLKYQLSSLKGQDTDDDIPIPDSYDDMADWVDKYLAGRLILHNKAKRSLKDAEYVDIKRVYQLLILLATLYRDMRLGQQSRENFDTACGKHSIDESSSISEVGAGMFGDTYYAKYRGKNVFIDRHLADRNSREPRFCLRIYFFWDDEDKVVVIGSLPGHLENRCS